MKADFRSICFPYVLNIERAKLVKGLTFFIAEEFVNRFVEQIIIGKPTMWDLSIEIDVLP